jgi:hypothetical protein
MGRFDHRRVAALLALAISLAAGAWLAAGAGARADHGRHWHGGSSFRDRVFASGAGLMHSIPGGSEQISQPDDITYLDGDVYVGFQNGVGPQGQASSSGNLDSTIVEFDLRGSELRQWDVAGKCDGLTADPELGKVIATVNEDANSSIYLIDPWGGARHNSYSQPLPSDGGTDAITIHHGMVLISASAPGTTGAAAPEPSYPAVYRVTFDDHTQIATIAPLFFDESTATVANTDSPDSGSSVSLALTDPDSNENVPGYANRFAGDFMLTSQGDQQQIFVRHAGRHDQRLSVLNLSSSVDDTAWPTGPDGRLLSTDNAANTIVEITGPFRPGSVYVADTPCDEDSAPSTCPGPGFPPNFLGQLNPWTGAITAVALDGPAVQPQGMLFLPFGRARGRGHGRRPHPRHGG